MKVLSLQSLACSQVWKADRRVRTLAVDNGPNRCRLSFYP